MKLNGEEISPTVDVLSDEELHRAIEERLDILLGRNKVVYDAEIPAIRNSRKIQWWASPVTLLRPIVIQKRVPEERNVVEEGFGTDLGTEEDVQTALESRMAQDEPATERTGTKRSRALEEHHEDEDAPIRRKSSLEAKKRRIGSIQGMGLAAWTKNPTQTEATPGGPGFVSRPMSGLRIDSARGSKGNLKLSSPLNPKRTEIPGTWRLGNGWIDDGYLIALIHRLSGL